MAKRQHSTHPSAAPLLACIEAGKFTRAEAARRLKLESVQIITNWLRMDRGIPSNRLSDVAALCGLSTDDYRARAGLIPAAPGSSNSARLIAEFEALPDGLKFYLTRKASELRRYSESLTPFQVRATIPPDDPTAYQNWERELHADMLHQEGRGNNKPNVA